MFGNASLVFILLSVFCIPEIVLAVVEGNKSIGSLFPCAHDLAGEVIVVNEREIIIKGFHYDGKGPASWFHGQLKGATSVSSGQDFKALPYPKDDCHRLKVGQVYNDKEISLILPVNITDLEAFGVFCYEFCANFGHVIIPADLEVPEAPPGLMVVKDCPKPPYNDCHKSKFEMIDSGCTAKTEATVKKNAGTVHVGSSVLVTISAVLAISMALKKQGAAGS